VNMAYLLLVCQLLLAVVLLVAATGKLINSEQFAAALRLSHLPKALITPLMVLTPILELCLAFGLVLSTSYLLPLIMIGTAGLLSVFTLWMLTVYARGLRLRCGCFGAGGSDIGLRTILRNALLVAVSLGSLALTFRVQSPLPTLSFGMVVTVLSLGMCVMLLWSFWQGKAALILSVAQLVSSQENTESSSAS
jgi:methylamine utilization protein MauE